MPRPVRDLVLVGGGHAHVQVLRSFGFDPPPGVRVTLVTRDVLTPYSGMLPGFIAGHYTHAETHIDLARLCRFAGARLVQDSACGLDRGERRVLCRTHPPVGYDVVSLDIGSTPRADDVPGAAVFTTGVKPVDRLSERWDGVVERVRTAERPPVVVMVGGGAAGVELVLAMEQRFAGLGASARLVLVTRGPVMESHRETVRAIFRRRLAARGVTLRENTAVVAVEPGELVLADGTRLAFDEALWSTQAGAAPWLRETGLALDHEGFVAVDATLRSVTDPAVFAAGDVAAVLPHPRPKAGVFAVRQGPPLTANLRRALAGHRPRPFAPQRHFLTLISTGDRAAVAAKGPFHAHGRWVWRWKDWIDRRFMRGFHALPERPPAAA